MSKEEILEIFDWLEINMNKNKLLYFKLLDNNQIGAYFKTNNYHFADFYINAIRKVIEEFGWNNDI
ncbi:MAG: hypothetical protein HFI86_02130 [Bacilli bacterium]|nr:hypothetical protein [Bacilli bacterium]